MPVSFAWDMAQQWLPEQTRPFQVTAERGTIWQGEVQFKYMYFEGSAAWILRPWQLFSSGEWIDLHLQSVDGELLGQGGYADGAVSVSGLMSLDLQALRPILSQHRIDLGGELMVNDLLLAIDPLTRRPVAASGFARWEGGPVSYPLGRKRQSADMPPLLGELGLRGDSVELAVSDEISRQNVMLLRVTPDGYVELQVRRRLLDLAAAPWSQRGQPDDVVFKIKQPLKM